MQTSENQNMEHWHGIKPKSYNQSKHSGSKQSTPRSKTVIKSGNKVSPDKSIEDEVARAVQQIIALNKSEQSSYDKNMPNMSSVNDEEDDISNTPVATQKVFPDEDNKPES